MRSANAAWGNDRGNIWRDFALIWGKVHPTPKMPL
jgi:hypothetical protein